MNIKSKKEKKELLQKLKKRTFFMKEKTKLQVLKIPLNFGFSKFLREIDYAKIKIHKIYNKFSKRLSYFILILIC